MVDVISIFVVDVTGRVVTEINLMISNTLEKKSVLGAVLG